MRAFIAIPLKEDIKQTLFDIQQQCRQRSKKGNFTEKENFHMTLHFLGEVTTEDIEDLKQAIYETAIRNREEKGVVWVGTEQNKILFRLFESLQKGLTKQGFARDRKKLSPHITLAREVVPYGSFVQMQKSVVVEQKQIEVDCITLFESVRMGRKLLYQPIFTEMLSKR